MFPLRLADTSSIQTLLVQRVNIHSDWWVDPLPYQLLNTLKFISTLVYNNHSQRREDCVFRLFQELQGFLIS